MINFLTHFSDFLTSSYLFIFSHFPLASHSYRESLPGLFITSNYITFKILTSYSLSLLIFSVHAVWHSKFSNLNIHQDPQSIDLTTFNRHPLNPCFSIQPAQILRSIAIRTPCTYPYSTFLPLSISLILQNPNANNSCLR